MATSFDEQNDWAHPEADIKTQIYIDNDGTYYRTYVDLDQLVRLQTPQKSSFLNFADQLT